MNDDSGQSHKAKGLCLFELIITSTLSLQVVQKVHYNNVSLLRMLPIPQLQVLVYSIYWQNSLYKGVIFYRTGSIYMTGVVGVVGVVGVGTDMEDAEASLVRNHSNFGDLIAS